MTLPEVLVTLAIISVLAAVMIPALTGQLAKGDAGRVAEDLKAIQTGMGAFVADVRVYPRTVNQLTRQITNDASFPRLGGRLSPTGAYLPAQLPRWRGPYMVKSIATAQTSVITGFDALIDGTFSSSTTTDLVTPYVAISVTGLDQTQLDRVDLIIDDGVSTTGLFRTESGNGAFYALPIQ